MMSKDAVGRISSRGFRISVGDDPDHKNLTAEIYHGEQLFAVMTQEDGFDRLRIEFFPHPSEKCWDLSVSETMSTIETAKEKLWQLRKI